MSRDIMIGGAVVGSLYGACPHLVLGRSDGIAGRWLPVASVDQYGAMLARCYGVPATGLATVFPNLANFGSSDLGFMLE